MFDTQLVRASHGHVHQVDILADLLHGNYSSVTTVEEEFPDSLLGLGVADRLDGEIVSVEGVTWRIPASGKPVIAEPDLGLPFAISAKGGRPLTLSLKINTTQEDLARIVERIVKEENDSIHTIAAVRVEGIFKDVLLRSEIQQEPPFQHLDQVLRHEVQFPFEFWRGTLVGFSFPSIENNGTVVPGLHLHAISHDRESGGHSHRATVEEAELQVWLSDSDIAVPRSRVSHAIDLLQHVVHHGAPGQRERARLLIAHLQSADATPSDFAEAIALHDAYLHDPYLEKR